MALLANRLAQHRFEGGRVDDGVIRALRGVRLTLPLDVQFAWTVAALAANSQLRRQRRAKAIDRVSHRLGLVAVAVDTRGIDGPEEMTVLVLAHVGRQVPAPAL